MKIKMFYHRSRSAITIGTELGSGEGKKRAWFLNESRLRLRGLELRFGVFYILGEVFGYFLGIFDYFSGVFYYFMGICYYFGGYFGISGGILLFI